MEKTIPDIDHKLDIAPQNVHFALSFIDSLISIICEMSEKNARQIRHGATFLTANKEEVHTMGGVEALSGFGLMLNGMKNGIAKEYQEFVAKKMADKEKETSSPSNKPEEVDPPADVPDEDE